MDNNTSGYFPALFLSPFKTSAVAASSSTYKAPTSYKLVYRQNVIYNFIGAIH